MLGLNVIFHLVIIIKKFKNCLVVDLRSTVNQLKASALKRYKKHYTFIA